MQHLYKTYIVNKILQRTPFFQDPYVQKQVLFLYDKNQGLIRNILIPDMNHHMSPDKNGNHLWGVLNYNTDVPTYD